MGITEDTVQGQIVSVEIKPFRNITTIVVGMPNIVTLVQIRDDKGKNYLGYIHKEVTDIHVGQRIVCAMKKTWDAYWVYRTPITLTLEGPKPTIGMGGTVYRKISQYQIIS